MLPLYVDLNVNTCTICANRLFGDLIFKLKTKKSELKLGETGG